MILSVFWFSLPNPLFKSPCSTILEDRYGNLLGAKIAKDGQWRFPNSNAIPEKFKKAIVQFEDRNFWWHPGFNPFSFGRAMLQNIKAKKIVSGGSTLTMQVIRLARKNKKRTFLEKTIELIMALRLELTYSKEEILSLYAANAPFGSNVVGIEAASWRYYGRAPDKLSWAEVATLAVLPNSPSLIYPGKNSKKLRNKRDCLLRRLHLMGYLDDITCELAKQEPLPGKPYPLPKQAPHLLDRAIKDGYDGEVVEVSIDGFLQEQINRIVAYHHKNLAANDVNNAAVLVLDVKTNKVISYVGNTLADKQTNHGNDVDIITAHRSTGSILKPFLYAAMLNQGQILQGTLIPDIPTQISGFSPENFNKQYDGAVPAKRALARSLNIPAVKMLQDFGIEKFHFLLKKLGMTTLTKPASYYGLALILGGAEGNLWDLAGIYANLSRILSNYTKYNGKYNTADFYTPTYLLNDKRPKEATVLEDHAIIDAAAIWFMFEAMIEVARPDEDIEWQQFSSSSSIAWKTGTSYGNRDGWAIGCTPQYVVAVWVGNADGEGRPALTGIGTAAPIMFDVFKILHPSGWFSKPYDDMEKIPVCKYSGYRASILCESVDTTYVPRKGIKTLVCPYHQLVHLDKSGKYRVNSDCEQVENMIHVPWFILPPVQEWYYKNKNSFYKVLPPYRDDCASSQSTVKSMDIIYPKNLSKIYVPTELDETRGKVIFKVAHRQSNATIFWHLDDLYLGATTTFHQMGLSPDPGKHKLTLIDSKGESLVRTFTISSKEK